MKRSIYKQILLALTVLASANMVHAQCSDWKWPEDKAKAEEKNVLYTDALRNSNFKGAQKPHMWLLTNAPDLNTAIYINGEKIYKGLLDETKDDAMAKVYYDSLVMMYDMRMQYCGEEADVMPKKAYQSYLNFARTKDVNQLPTSLEYFDKAYELNGNNLDYYLILPYMSIVVYNAQYKKNLSEEQILDHYDKIMGVIDHQISKGMKVDKLTEYRGKVDGLLVKVVQVDCEFVKKNLAPKFNDSQDPDIKLAKKIFGFMLNGKCTDDPLWLEAGKVIQEKEPEFGLAKNIGIKLKGKDNANAEKYFRQAIELTDDPAEKADMYIQLGSLSSGSSARELYRKALSLDPTKKEAYTAIGFLYYQSFNDCAGKSDVVKDRAVFLAAYDMFERGGNGKAMQSAKEQFPSKEEVFTYNYTAGNSVTVGCWIGETTTIRTRD